MSKHLEIVLLCVFASIASAADPLTPDPTEGKQTELERLEQRESIGKATEALKQAEVSLDATTRARKFKCLKAFGNEGFCECLNEKLVLGLDFEGDVALITRTKDELKYSTLSKEDRALVDDAIATRNTCAK